MAGHAARHLVVDRREWHIDSKLWIFLRRRLQLIFDRQRFIAVVYHVKVFEVWK